MTVKDRIPAELLKSGTVITNWLFELLTEVWETERIPQVWKDSELISLHKKVTEGSVTTNGESASLVFQGRYYP